MNWNVVTKTLRIAYPAAILAAALATWAGAGLAGSSLSTYIFNRAISPDPGRSPAALVSRSCERDAYPWSGSEEACVATDARAPRFD